MADRLDIIRGTSNTFKILVVDEDGDPYTLASGEVLVFGIKHRPYIEDAAVVKTATNGTDGIYTVGFNPEDTLGLKYGKYFWDAGIRSGEDYYPLFKEPGVFEILPNATKWGDAE